MNWLGNVLRKKRITNAQQNKKKTSRAHCLRCQHLLFLCMAVVIFLLHRHQLPTTRVPIWLQFFLFPRDFTPYRLKWSWAQYAMVPSIQINNQVNLKRSHIYIPCKVFMKRKRNQTGSREKTKTSIKKLPIKVRRWCCINIAICLFEIEKMFRHRYWWFCNKTLQ